MAFSSVEILALILIIVTAIKLIVISISPSAWMNNVVRKVYGKPGILMMVSLLLAGLVLYYLIQELSIVQILAVMLFLSLLMAITVSAYSEEVLAMADTIYQKGGLLKKAWLSLIIWIVLLLWGLKELFL